MSYTPWIGLEVQCWTVFDVFFFYCLWIFILLCYYGYGVTGWDASVEFLSCAILGLSFCEVARWVWCEHGMAWHGYLEWRGAHRLVV